MNKQLKFLIVIVLLCTGLSSMAKGRVTVSGIIKGYKGEETIFLKDSYDQNDPGITVKVSKNGSFKIAFDLEKRSFDASLTIGSFMYMFYIQPGGKYIVNADITTEGDESKYTISGSNAKENRLVKNYVLTLQRSYLIWDKLVAIDSFAPYNNFVDGISSSLESELEPIKNPEFISIMKQRIDQDKTYLKFLFGFNALQKEVKKNGSTLKFQPDADYEAFLASREWTSIDEKVFLRFIQPFMYSVVFTCPDVPVVEVLKNIKKMLPTQNAVNQFSSTIVTYFFSKGGNGNPDDVFEYYKTISTDTEAIKVLDQSRMYAKALAPGLPAPDFEMKDKDGKIFKLSDFKGKALFVDVWATWCAPCKAEIPFFKKLVEKYKGDDRIEFISVSVDSNKKGWMKMITAESHDWKQLIVDNDMSSDLCRKYQVISIPRFMLFDKEGKIISVTGPYPSDEEINEFISKAL